MIPNTDFETFQLFDDHTDQLVFNQILENMADKMSITMHITHTAQENKPQYHPPQLLGLPASELASYSTRRIPRKFLLLMIHSSIRKKQKRLLYLKLMMVALLRAPLLSIQMIAKVPKFKSDQNLQKTKLALQKL